MQEIEDTLYPATEGASTTLAPAEDPNIGVVLQERYRIVRKLGEGGMGRVYEGEHVVIKRRVAIKCLHAQYATNAEVVARFHREALAATSIGNEHIVEVTDMGRFPDGAVYMVLEYLEGRDLADEIESHGPLAVGRAVRITRQICDALTAAHAKGIIHRDLKPENVYLIRRGRDSDFVKVLDFGISKFRDGNDGAKTGTGVMIGTPHAMAPEQIEGVRDIDHRIDLYAIGVILYMALVGRPPFQAESVIKLIHQVCMTPPPPLRPLRPDVPEALEQVVLRCLAKDRADRYPDCAALSDALEPFEDIAGAPVTVESDRAARMNFGTPAPGSTHHPASQRSGVAPDASTGAAPSGPSASSPSIAPVASAPPRSPGVKLTWIAGGVGLVAVVAIGLGVGFARGGAPAPATRSEPAVAPRVTPELAPSAVAPVAPSAPVTPVALAAPAALAAPTVPAPERTVRVRMSTDPDDAELLLDGNRIANPFDADLPQSTEVHRLEARRDGHRAVVQDLVLQYAQSVRLRLRRGSGVEDRRRVRDEAARSRGASEVAPAAPAVAPAPASPPAAGPSPRETNTAPIPSGQAIREIEP